MGGSNEPTRTSVVLMVATGVGGCVNVLRSTGLFNVWSITGLIGVLGFTHLFNVLGITLSLGLGGGASVAFGFTTAHARVASGCGVGDDRGCWKGRRYFKVHPRSWCRKRCW